MTTKDHCLFFKNKQQNLVVNDNLNGQFNNLNLNQNYRTYAEVTKAPLNVENQNKAISNYDNFDRTAVLTALLDNSFFNNDLQTRQKYSTLFGKTKLGPSFANLNIQKDYGKKEEKPLNANNSSTLSLHISAYENSIEATSGDPGGEKDGTKKNKENISSIKNLKAVKEIFNDSSSGVNYAFEFPRQQHDQNNNDPEVMQFKTSQQLANTRPSVIATKFLKKGTIIESSNTKRRYEVVEIIKRGNICIIAKLQERNVPVWQKNKIFSMKAECGTVMDEEIGLKIELNILAKAAEARHLRPAMVDNIVEIFDRGITDDFRFIIVTSLGMNLADLQKSVKGLPIQTAVRINKRMFNAIRNLHTLGFIHRNIQPSNFAIGSQKAQTAIVFIIGFSLAAKYETDINGFEIDNPNILAQKYPSKNTLNAMFMSRRCHSTLNLTRLDDIESWLFSCLEISMMESLPWKKCFIASEALEMKKNFFLHQYTFELFFERIPIDYRRIIDIINSSKPKSTPDYTKICEINDRICKQYPTLNNNINKKRSPSNTANSPIPDTAAKSLILPTICLPPSNNNNNTNEDNTHSLYGLPPTKDVFTKKEKREKEMKSKIAKKATTTAPASAPPKILPAAAADPKDAKKKTFDKNNNKNNNAAATVNK